VNKLKLKLSILSAALLAATAGSVYSADRLPAYPVKGHVVEQLHRFNNPESAIFSADAKHAFVSNAALYTGNLKGTHFIDKGGFISKLAVSEDGTVKVVDEKIVTGLTSPLGMARNSAATEKFPKGAIFVCTGAAPVVGADGKEVKDPQLIDPKLVAFDEDGRVLGEIKLGWDTPFARKSGKPVTLANAAGFDQEGNLYFSDTGTGAPQFEPPLVQTGGGVYMIPHASLDALAEGKEAQVYFVPFPQGGPDGVQVAPDGTIEVNTYGKAAGMNDPANGGTYKLTQDDFKSGRLPAPIQSGLGALDGLAFLGADRLETWRMQHDQVLVTGPSQRTMRLEFDKQVKLNGPADIAVHRYADGSALLLIPEFSPKSSKHKDAVTVVRLPADFDRR
jgi:hypothetical protein